MTLQQKKIPSEPASWIVILAMIGIFSMSLGMGGSKSLQNIGMALVLFSSLLAALPIWRKIRRDPMFYLVLTFLAYLLIRTVFAQFELPDLTDDHWDRARRMSRIILLPLVAYWISKKPHWLKHIFVFFAAGVLLAIFLGIWDSGIKQFFLDHRRAHFVLNPQRMGYVSGLTFVGLIIFRAQIIAWSRRYISLFGAWVLWTLFVCLIFQAFLASQARGAFLGLIIASVILMSVLFAKKFFAPHKSSETKIPSIIALTIVILISTMAFFQKDIILQRFLAESDVVQQLVEGETDNLRLTSITIRNQLWKIGYNAWLEKPFFGWGTDGAQKIISQADAPERVKELNHFHNTYLDILVRFGIVGFLLFGAIMHQLVKSLWNAYKNQKICSQTSLLLVYGFLFFLLVNITETHLIPSWGWFMLALLGGSMYFPTLDQNESSKTQMIMSQ